MDELKHLANSRKGFRIHLKKLLVKSSDLVQRQHKKPTDSDIPSLTKFTNLLDHLKCKDELISALDTQIMKLITRTGFRGM